MTDGPNLGAVGSIDWRMWGQEKLLTIPQGRSESEYVQLINISHSHPEAWRFLLAAQWLTAPGLFGLTVQFGIIIGQGLTRMSLQSPAENVSDNESFGFFYWANNVNPRRWTTRVRTPDVNDLFVPGTPGYAPSFAEVVVGQTIVLGAKAFYGNPAPAGGMKIRVQASFAPNVYGENGPRRALKQSQWRPDVQTEEAGWEEGGL